MDATTGMGEEGGHNATIKEPNFEGTEGLRSTIRKQVADGFKRRDKEFVRITFDSHKDHKTGSILASSLESALSNLGISSGNMVDEINTNDGGLDFEEFWSLVTAPSPIEEWVSALHVHQLIADAMPKIDSCQRKDQLCHLSSMTQQQLCVSCDVIMEYLVKIMQENLDLLKDAYTKLSNQSAPCLNEKNQISEMCAGNVDNFHKGLAAHIGKSRTLQAACQGVLRWITAYYDLFCS
jgi:hypothetical protein